ncbi:MAG: CBS domain-containing protein [Gammaproteobacteria bacterium]|nr:CBS domain-containing protein [Gammaproteobacteria bacterium]
MKNVQDLLNKKDNTTIYSVSPVSSVYQAIELMSEHHVGALPVLQDRSLVGIISERDYARKVILKNKSSKATRVSEIMTRHVICVSQEQQVNECVNLMLKNHIRHLVVTQEGTVVGMLSLRDLFVEIIDDQAETISHLEHYIRGET